MGSCKFTVFGVSVKTALLQQGETQEWLGKQITEKTGLFVDSGYMYKILTGQRNAPKVVQAIREILNITEEQEQRAGDIQTAFDKYKNDPAYQGQI